MCSQGPAHRRLVAAARHPPRRPIAGPLRRRFGKLRRGAVVKRVELGVGIPHARRHGVHLGVHVEEDVGDGRRPAAALRHLPARNEEVGRLERLPLAHRIQKRECREEMRAAKRYVLVAHGYRIGKRVRSMKRWHSMKTPRAPRPRTIGRIRRPRSPSPRRAARHRSGARRTQRSTRGRPGDPGFQPGS